ncbi:uncharacterized protein LOC105695891 [Orussus abietinus]|uniref:uncharacterized protein LOC105695891 n=1 Tax=Orussus abietinus TaxID=222816 RepID=UPI0006250FB1|nr:uncharacterized protein LOC105695891 [Orussus abietinus]XP_012273333.1 uncharacterized protein LOC105695891 [Orussus abietinus]XP_012273343.1 uncharacterized protein LOC105695891 [Orussus abietinus]XP_012273352.1 uncharacterized protein LOC105695891 [Orussus abietinus]XP_012273361.1 uncharacterized protein LOC105695891 [Orussus abietinus]
MQHRIESKILHEEQILEAIDQIRRRKARPDADRICNYLLRKFSVDARDTIADLHRLIEAEKVIQVDYKGNTSYRNASKWSRLQLYKNRPEGFVKEKLNFAMVASAVSELVVEEPDYLDQGVPAPRLVEQLLDGVSNPTSRRMVEEFLGKEVASGNLARLANGNYSLVATAEMASVAGPLLAVGVGVPEKGGLRTGTATGTGTGAGSGTLDVDTPPATSVASRCLYDFEDEDAVEDSRSTTPRSSRQASPKPDPVRNKEECYEIIVGRSRRKASDSAAEEEEDDDDDDDDDEEEEEEGTEHVEVGPRIGKEEDGLGEDALSGTGNLAEVCDHGGRCIVDGAAPNLKRTSKAERKQRLLVRTDDPMDIEIKFEDYRQETKEQQECKRFENDGLSEDRDEEDNGPSSTNPSPTPSNVNNAGFRSARRKRAKKVFDPSDNNLVKRKRGRQPGVQNKAGSNSQEALDIVKTPVKEGPNRQCSLCAKEKQERLVACRDCTVRAHPSCIYSPEELVQKLGTSWQCERCKSCTICCETSDAGPLVTCSSCDDAYHYSCHTPRVSVPKSNGKWQCNNCTQKQFKSTLSQTLGMVVSRPDTPSNPPVLPPVLSPQVSPVRGSFDQVDEDGPKDGIDPNIPDASDWTSEQVYQYFARLFPKEAEVFRQQDIDGHSLLLMKRSDVLSGLDLLLGPALKIYRHVLKLQVRRDDPRLYWL